MTIPLLLFFFFLFEQGLEYKETLLWGYQQSVKHKKELERELISSNIS
jgi:hypothetical protein